MFCKLKSCQKCGGDLALDGDEWRCWQCGRHYYPKPLLMQALVAARELEPIPARVWPEEEPWPQRGRQRRRTARHVNAMIESDNRNEQRWWMKNQEVIQYLEEGRAVREISSLVGRGVRWTPKYGQVAKRESRS